MSVEIIANGTAHRTSEGVATTDNYRQREYAKVTGQYTITREIETPYPDLDFYFRAAPFEIVTTIFRSDATGNAGEGWRIADTDPGSWDVSMHADVDGLIESAEAAGQEREKDPAEILLQWSEYQRAPTNALLDAYHQYTGKEVPEGEA